MYMIDKEWIVQSKESGTYIAAESGILIGWGEDICKA